jgi:anti-sigma factor RsiW
MLKSTTWFLVFAILTVSITFPVSAQQVPAKDAVVPAAEKDPVASDLKDVFARQTAKVKADESVFDPVKTERERGKQQSQKPGMSKTKKALLWTALAVGVAALIFVAIKYAKKCIRYSDDCDYNPDTGNYDCPCEEYEERNN